jgi:GT2 family glycosyltransferase
MLNACWSGILAQRYEMIISRYVSNVPLASIVVVTYNNLAYTQLCIESILRNTEYPNYEIIVVDNNSSDDTPDYLHALEQTCSNVRVVFNDENCGFAKANNQGIE